MLGLVDSVSHGRGHCTELLYNCIADSQDGEIGLVDAAETAAANSNAVMIGNIVVSKDRGAGWNTGRFIQFGQDSGGAHNGTLYAINNTLVAGTSSVRFFDANASGSSIVAVNNVLYGSNHVSSGNGPVSGSNNWMPDTASVPAGFTGTATGADPGFENMGGRNCHLTASSPCRDIGASSPSYVDGDGVSRAGIPSFEYLDHLQGVARAADGHLDAGACEYVSAADPDTDGDGMPDWWETLHSLDPATDDADEDPDGDGLTNVEEYERRSDPGVADAPSGGAGLSCASGHRREGTSMSAGALVALAAGGLLLAGRRRRLSARAG